MLSDQVTQGQLGSLQGHQGAIGPAVCGKASGWGCCDAEGALGSPQSFDEHSDVGVLRGDLIKQTR